MREALIQKGLNISIIDTTIFRMLYVILFIDSINGFFMYLNINVPISQLFKIALLSLMLFRIITNEYGRILIWGSIFYMAVLFWIYSFRADYNLLSTYTHLSKFLITVWTYAYFKQLVQQDPKYIYNIITKIIKTNTIVLVCNILLGLIGLGTTTYESIGSKGYFYAGNEISGIIMILFPLYLYNIGNNKSFQSRNYYYLTILFLLSSILLGTKTSIIATLLSIIFIPSFSIQKIKKNSFLKKLIIGIIGIIFIAIIGYMSLSKIGLVDRWAYIYNKGGIVSLLLSGRDQYWLEEKEELFKGGTENIFFGLGENRSVEMDPFDSFLNYGIIGFILIYAFYLYFLIISIKYIKKNSIAQLICFINIMLLSASSLSGHIIFSGMAGPFIAIANALIFVPDNIIKKYHHENISGLKFISLK